MNAKLSGIAAAGLLLVAGAVHAAAPVSTNETTVSPHPYVGAVSVVQSGAHVLGDAIPASKNETAASPHPFQGPTRARVIRTGGMESVFPVSYNETV